MRRPLRRLGRRSELEGLARVQELRAKDWASAWSVRRRKNAPTTIPLTRPSGWLPQNNHAAQYERRCYGGGHAGLSEFLAV